MTMTIKEECIACGACIPECPFEAIFPEDEVPSAYTAKGGEMVNLVGLTEHYEGVDHHGKAVVLNTVRTLKAGEVVDLTKDIQPNYDFYTKGPGYKANE